MKTTKHRLKQILLNAAILSCVGLYSCDDDDAPEAENEVEAITSVTLTFTPQGGGTPAIASAVDADGLGPGNFTQLLTPELEPGTTYDLTMSLLDARDPSDIEDIGEEVEEEDDEHQFYFFVTGSIFTADGSDIPGTVYQDTDDNNLPVGLETTWTTSASAASGEFRVILRHQPDEKNQASATDRAVGITTGDEDFDFTFDINIGS
ncbi:MAG: GTP cyclohydrolase [Bacteroidota bacterium]